MAVRRKTAPTRKTVRRPGPADRGRPPGFSTVTPYLSLDGAARAVEFYKTAFGARELQRESTPDGKIVHSRLKIGDSLVMLSDRFEPAETLGGPSASPPVTLHLYVPDVDAVWAKAIAAGAKVLMPLDDMFWGERYGQLRDPFGQRWSVAMRVPMSKAERDEKRAAAMRTFASGSHPGESA